MAGNVYALLVGIDRYPNPAHQLHGCVNDIQRVKTLLESRIGAAQFKPVILLDEQAKRQSIIDMFRHHLGQAGPDDAVLFYYSGHGSQEKAPPAFWHLEPDRLDETLVCWDSRLEDGWDLADKELAQLIFEVAQKQPHVTVILDCCHSGSGTRDVLQDGVVAVRRVTTDERVRPLDTFIVSTAQAERLDRGVQTDGGWFRLPVGKHVIFSACSAEELAKELYLGGEPRGAFSYYLLDTLQCTDTHLSYRDLFKRLDALVRSKVAQQSPQMEATDLADLDQPFLGGALPAHAPYFTVSQHNELGWVIDGGQVHGIPPVSNAETTYLVLFPFDTRLDDLSNATQSIGQAQITQTLPAVSQVQITLRDHRTPDPETTYKAVVAAMPLTPMMVALEGDATGLAFVRQALAQAGPEGKSSQLVREGTPQTALYRLVATDNHYLIRRLSDVYPLVTDTPGFNAAGATLVVQRLEHIARRLKILELANPTARLAADAIRVELFRTDETGQAVLVDSSKPVRLEYSFKNNRWVQPTFKIKLTNTSQQNLFCMALDLTEMYGVDPSLLPGGGLWLAPGQEVWLNNGEFIFGEVPTALWRQGLSETRDMLKFIVSTDAADATLLAQGDLPVAVVKNLFRESPIPTSTLGRLMARVNTRALRARPAEDEIFADWTTTVINLVTVRPQPVAALQATKATSLGAGVTVQSHPALQANARLTNLPEASRDIGNLALPALLRDNPTVEPFQFVTSRGGEPGLSVLELTQVENYTAVTPAHPLVINTNVTLQPAEHLLPVGFDGEFYLPLGRAQRSGDGTEIILERLPDPTTAGTRSLGGSIKIYFQKVANQYLHTAFAYPVLAEATLDTQDKVTYLADVAHVTQRVAASNRIVLYIHGIIGDTLGMAASAEPARLLPPVATAALADRYDLLLTFDYENINTSIEDNARLLKDRLTAVGLGPDHGKTLHIVAHSMGGLVARWFIEREGGNTMVQHLVTLGTPNGGSPWPAVEDWALTALAIGLNSLTTIAWPARALSTLVGAVEVVDVALDEMQPQSDFLKNLASSPDPGIPYTIIIGNTSLIASALQTQDSQELSQFARLWAKLKPKNWLHPLTGLAFFGEPNDIAVSIASSKNIPLHRSPQPLLLDPVACDHVTYFSTEAGLQALAKALAAV